MDMEEFGFELPEVDEEAVEETRRRFEAKQAEKMRRVMGGVDDRIVGDENDEANAENAAAAACANLTLEEREAKWGFSYDELKAATKVVSILFANPSLYLGDPLLAESRLYTMVTRDRRTKRENQQVLRQVLNEERNRKDKVKRQQDIATIRKTTMKKEREEALNHLLLVGDGRDGQGQGQLLLTNGGAAAGAEGETAEGEVKAADVSEATAAEAAAAASPKTNEIAAKAALPQQQKEQTAEELDAALYHRRCLAGLELLEVMHNPRELVPTVAAPKPLADGEKEDDNTTATVVRIKHGNNNRKGKDERWAKSIAAAEAREEAARRRKMLSHADAQQWRCALTALYSRFWPAREFSTQMVRAVSYADTWPAVTPEHLRHIRNLEAAKTTNNADGSEEAPLFVTVDAIHQHLCVATSRVSFLLESALSDAHAALEEVRHSSSDAAAAAAVDPTLLSVTNITNELRSVEIGAGRPAAANDNGDDAAANTVRQQSAIKTIVSLLLNDGANKDASASGGAPTTPHSRPFASLIAAAASGNGLASVRVPADPTTGVASLRAAFVESHQAAEAEIASDDEGRRQTTIGALLASLQPALRSSATSAAATAAATADSSNANNNSTIAAVGQLATTAADAIDALLSSSPSSADALRRAVVALAGLSAAVIAAHWAQYSALFEVSHGNKAMRGNANKKGGGPLFFDPEATENDTFHSSSSAAAEKENDDDVAEDESALFLVDPFAGHPLLARGRFAEVAYPLTALYCAIAYGAQPPQTAANKEEDEEEAVARRRAREAAVFGTGPAATSLFNGVRMAWLGLPPEAEVDGTIPNEEGLFDSADALGGVNGDAGVGIPYSDAMLFAAPASASTANDADAAAASGGAHAPSGCIVALRRETSHQLLMNRTQKCHTCKGRYKFLHPFYYSMCRPCSDYNYNKRLITRDLRGKVVLLTGARIKIGYAMAVSLLRCGATVIGTTRFAMDAMGRFAAEPDFLEWRHRLHLYSVDLRDMWLVTQFCNFLSRKFPKLFAIINNAAQTIARTAAYTADLRRLEANPPPELRRTFAHDSSAVEWRQFFLENTSVTVGQSLHLDYHPTENPIVDGDFTSSNTALRSLETTAFGAAMGPNASASLQNKHEFSAAAEKFLAEETAEERHTRLRRDGGDAVGHAVLSDSSLAAHLAKRSDRYDTFAEESDKREKNSWTMNLGEVQGSEAAEVMAINALSPFILNSRLKPLLMNRDGEEDAEEAAEEERARLRREAVAAEEGRAAGAAGGQKSNRALKREALAQADGAAQLWNTKKASRFIINVSAMEGQFYRHKLTTHPHTNMAKAALNMMTRTSAEDYARDGIFMNSVDTGWITDESPATKKQRRADDNMLCPLDEVDAAARCLDLIYTDSREFGKFWKNYKVIPW